MYSSCLRKVGRAPFNLHYCTWVAQARCKGKELGFRDPEGSIGRKCVGTEDGRTSHANGPKASFSVSVCRGASAVDVYQGPKSAKLVSTSKLMVRRRHFSSRSKDDEEDDVEARLLMREDMGREGSSSMGSTAFGMGGGARFDDYGDEGQFDDTEWSQHGGDTGDEGSSDDLGSDEDDSEESGNELSDEEFEGNITDEELDQLLAETPLFDPPEPPEDSEQVPEFSFRPEGPVFYPGMEYEPQDLDVTRPLPPRTREPRPKLEISVQEVLDNADFRNPRYLTKFISETGTILARKEFKMRNKSHGRITKAIKTARFFGLMPYTNMGRPKYVFNEPYDEFEEFYETDEEEKKLQVFTAAYTEKPRGPGDGKYFRKYQGPNSGSGMWRKFNGRE